MGNDPRWVPPGALVEATQKAIHGRYLLRPSRDLVEVFNGVLIRAAQRYAVEVCALRGATRFGSPRVARGPAALASRSGEIGIL